MDIRLFLCSFCVLIVCTFGQDEISTEDLGQDLGNYTTDILSTETPTTPEPPRPVIRKS